MCAVYLAACVLLFCSSKNNSIKAVLCICWEIARQKLMMTPKSTTLRIIACMCCVRNAERIILYWLFLMTGEWTEFQFHTSLLKDSLPILTLTVLTDWHVCMSHRFFRCFKIISVSQTDEHLRLPPTPPSSHGSDSDGSQSPHSLPPLSPGHLQSPHSLPPSSPARLQARTSTAISSSPLLTAPHVSHTQHST